MLKKKKSFERKRLKHGTVTLSRAPFREQCMKEVLATSHFNCFYLKLSVIFSWEKNMKKISEVLTSVLICRAKALLFLFFFSPPYSIITGAPDGLSEQHNTAGMR